MMVSVIQQLYVLVVNCSEQLIWSLLWAENWLEAVYFG